MTALPCQIVIWDGRREKENDKWHTFTPYASMPSFIKREGGRCLFKMLDLALQLDKLQALPADIGLIDIDS